MSFTLGTCPLHFQTFILLPVILYNVHPEHMSPTLHAHSYFKFAPLLHPSATSLHPHWQIQCPTLTPWTEDRSLLRSVVSLHQARAVETPLYLLYMSFIIWYSVFQCVVTVISQKAQSQHTVKAGIRLVWKNIWAITSLWKPFLCLICLCLLNECDAVA